MIKTENKSTTLTCDKCGTTQTAPEDEQFQFFDAEWTMSSAAKKFTHLCYSCKTKKQKKPTDFVREKFGGNITNQATPNNTGG